MKKSLILILFAFLVSSIHAADLPKGYGGVELGMTFEETKKALKDNLDFGYKGERDVSLLPGENRVLIETDTSMYAGFSYLERCWFQFYNDRLYIITINIDREKMDHYSVFSSLCKKYGDPLSVSPEKSARSVAYASSWTLFSYAYSAAVRHSPLGIPAFESLCRKNS